MLEAPLRKSIHGMSAACQRYLPPMVFTLLLMHVMQQAPQTGRFPASRPMLQNTRRMRRSGRSRRPRSVPKVEFLSLASQLIKGRLALCRHALLVVHNVQKMNATMCAHLVESQITRFKLADEKWPAYAEDLGSLLRRQLSMHRNERHRIAGGHFDQEVD